METAKLVDFLAGSGGVPFDPDNQAEVAEYEATIARLSGESRRAIEEVNFNGHFLAMLAEEYAE